MRALAFAIVCLAGCFSKPDRPGGFVVTSCDAPFSAPSELLGLGTSVEGDVALRADDLELFFVHYNGTNYDIWHAYRASTQVAFTVDLQPLSFSHPDFGDTEPQLTADGELLAFSSRRTGSSRGYLVSRSTADLGDSWGTPVPIPGLMAEEMVQLELSWDGLTVYWNDSSMMLHIAERASREEDFLQLGRTFGTNLNFPTVAADKLEMFYDGNQNTTWRTVRSSEQEPFGPGTDVMLGRGDPDLSPDGQRLVLYGNTSAWVATRDCP